MIVLLHMPIDATLPLNTTKQYQDHQLPTFAYMFPIYSATFSRALIYPSTIKWKNQWKPSTLEILVGQLRQLSNPGNSPLATFMGHSTCTVKGCLKEITVGNNNIQGTSWGQFITLCESLRRKIHTYFHFMTLGHVENLKRWKNWKSNFLMTSLYLRRGHCTNMG